VSESLLTHELVQPSLESDEELLERLRVESLVSG
jgi:hypothetical protein